MEGRKLSQLNEIHSGDCLAWLTKLPDDSVDTIISSPPYNIGKSYESRTQLAEYMDLQARVLRECHRVLKDTGSIFWQVGVYADKGVHIPLDVKFFPVLEELGMVPRNRIVWVRPHGLHAKNKFSARHEAILWFSKGEEYKFFLDEIRVPQKYQNKKSWRGDNKGELTCNPLGKNPGDIWLFQNVKHNHEEQTVHPAQFPEDMVARMLLATTKPGDVVLDPYMGTGTVAVVARDHGRNFLGAELDPTYHEIAMQRLSGEPDADGVFPNLKTLRDYVARTGESIDKYRFQVQVGNKATERSKSKRFDEAHHLVELEKRLTTEEEAFGGRLRGDSDGLPNLPSVPNQDARETETEEPIVLF
ncbi:site-specific DNA-methyltransferase [Streptomyces sp. P9(2023)]|uniref:DNA-methyltransferase n=1 Tax=Streptomyces sp. P9(2023) TaxID=3064394 RepID=UPI0028F45B05|nr:site-specific DNA-methyltransferase [Streptomyces sp. P9(2023)]MDT9689851.1 site-specific DNA-methyltransferase [Streptomyces sp. P9(2023)]